MINEKSELTPQDKALKEEIKRLNKDVALLKSQKQSTQAKLYKKDAKLKETQKQLKKRHIEASADKRATRFSFELVSRHEYSILSSNSPVLRTHIHPHQLQLANHCHYCSNCLIVFR